jgi:hypothetical protein
MVIMMGISLPPLARAQSGVDVSPAIPVHPDVPTILQLPDEIVRLWFIDGGDLLVQGVGNKVFVRPRPDTPAGVEAFVEVETKTLHRMFLVRVTERAEDAMPEVTVPAPAAAECAEAAINTPSVAPAPAEPPAGTPGPASEPAAASAAASAEPMTERAVVAPSPRHFDLAVHVALALPGFTALEIQGYGPDTALRPHLGLGLRIAANRINSRWGFEANVSGEWPAGPMVYNKVPAEALSQLKVGGPWLRAEAGMRVGLERTGAWTPTAYVGLGVQAHLRRSTDTSDLKTPRIVTTMENGAVLALGVGLHYRTRDIVLGVDFQARGGGPDDYRSIDAFWTVGYLLDLGE